MQAFVIRRPGWIESKCNMAGSQSSQKLRMVDVGDKPVTRREATASGRIAMAAATLRLVIRGEVGKGDVLAAARLAGIMAAKRTSDIIPLCHPLTLDSVDVDVFPSRGGISVLATVRSTGRTGVEMEALTAVSAALLTAYDMLKPVDKKMMIGEIQLESKTGGQSGDWVRGKK